MQQSMYVHLPMYVNVGGWMSWGFLGNFIFCEGFLCCFCIFIPYTVLLQTGTTVPIVSKLLQVVFFKICGL